MVMEANLFISTSNSVAYWFKKKNLPVHFRGHRFKEKFFSEDLFRWGNTVYLFIDLYIIWLNYREMIIDMKPESVF